MPCCHGALEDFPKQESHLKKCDQVRLLTHESQCRSVCERATASRAARGLIQWSGRALERTAPDRLVSSPGTLWMTAGDWPAACQSALVPPPCPTEDVETQEGVHHFFFFKNLLKKTI